MLFLAYALYDCIKQVIQYIGWRYMIHLTYIKADAIEIRCQGILLYTHSVIDTMTWYYYLVIDKRHPVRSAYSAQSPWIPLYGLTINYGLSMVSVYGKPMQSQSGTKKALQCGFQGWQYNPSQNYLLTMWSWYDTRGWSHYMHSRFSGHYTQYTTDLSCFCAILQTWKKTVNCLSMRVWGMLKRCEPLIVRILFRNEYCVISASIVIYRQGSAPNT